MLKSPRGRSTDSGVRRSDTVIVLQDYLLIRFRKSEGKCCDYFCAVVEIAAFVIFNDGRNQV